MSKAKLKSPVSAELPVAPPVSNRHLPILLALFAGSGCAALIYEVVWFQLLQLVIGSSALSLGVLLGTYMGGMCLGSLLLPRYVSAREHPLRVYALIEASIGICGLLVLFAYPLIDHVYAALGGEGLWGIILRVIIAAICLLPPTLLMGASLPAIARWVETTPQGVSWLGFFYGGNIAGAVFGSLLAGFYLLRVYDMPTATFAAVAINALVAFISYRLAKKTTYRAAQRETDQAMAPADGSRGVMIAIALSGMCALGAEVIWTRLLSLMLGATVYTFSIILAVFLVGLGLGSAAGSQWSRHHKDARLALGLCQLLLAGGIAWTAYMVSDSIPNWPVNPLLATSPWFNFQIDLMRCLWAMLPPACLWGASFPLALAAVAARGQDAGKARRRSVRGEYGWRYRRRAGICGGVYSVDRHAGFRAAPDRFFGHRGDGGVCADAQHAQQNRSGWPGSGRGAGDRADHNGFRNAMARCGVWPAHDGFHESWTATVCWRRQKFLHRGL